MPFCFLYFPLVFLYFLLFFPVCPGTHIAIMPEILIPRYATNKQQTSGNNGRKAKPRPEQKVVNKWKAVESAARCSCSCTFSCNCCCSCSWSYNRSQRAQRTKRGNRHENSRKKKNRKKLKKSLRSRLETVLPLRCHLQLCGQAMHGSLMSSQLEKTLTAANVH